MIQEQGSLKFKSFNSYIIDTCLFNVGIRNPETEQIFVNHFLKDGIFAQIFTSVSQTYLGKE